MEKYHSIKQSAQEELMRFYDAELYLMATDWIDTYTPATLSMEATAIVVRMMIELNEFIQAKGKSDRTEKSNTRLKRLFEIICKLNNLTGDLNTLKLNNKELWLQLGREKKKNADLKQQVDNIKKAYEEL